MGKHAAAQSANSNGINEFPVGIVKVHDIHLSSELEKMFLTAHEKNSSLTRSEFVEKRTKALSKNNPNPTDALMIAGVVIVGKLSSSDHSEIRANFRENDDKTFSY